MATRDSSCSRHEAIDIVVVGGGVAGLATALALHRIGLQSVVLERSGFLRASGSAFTMWVNAWRALDALGVADTLRANYCPLDGIRGFSTSSGVQKDVHLRKNCTGGYLEGRCIERSALLETLAKALPHGSIRFNCKLVSINKKSDSPFTTLDLADGTSITAKIVIGCDGVNSVVAQWIGFEAAKTSGRVAIRGMANFPQGHHKIEKKMVQVLGKEVRAGFIPCTDKQVYWFITRKSQPRDADISSDPESLRCATLESVRDFPEPIGELIKSTPADTLNLTDLKFRWVWPWEWDNKAKGKGSVTVVGDALHPITPDLGQGASSALEDAVILARCLSTINLNLKDNWGQEEERMIKECFKEYGDARKWRMLSVIGVAFLAGIVLDGYSSFLRFLREWIWLPLFSMSHISYFAANSDCGTLPLQSTPGHAHKL